VLLVTCQLARGDRGAAKLALAAGRERFPNETRLLHQSAQLAAEDGDTAAALATYESITAIDAQDADAWVSLGDLYARAGKLDQSKAAFEQVVTLDPQRAPQLFYNIGALAMNKPDRSPADVQKAIAAFRRAVELKPDYVQAHKQLGFALLGTGDRAGARAELEQYVRLAPNASDAAQIQAMLKSLQ
jgi:Flp pilus assembly protein TadD